MDEMPDFDASHETPAAAPKKPRRKPMKRQKALTTPKKRASMLRVVKKARKKRRKTRVARKSTTDSGHAVGQFADEVYRTVSMLMGMKGPNRDLVLDIVKGLTS